MTSRIKTPAVGNNERPDEPTAATAPFDALVAEADMLLADLEARSLRVGMAAGLPFIGLARFELSATNFPVPVGVPDLPVSYEAGAAQAQELLSAAVEQSPSLESCLHILRAQGLLREHHRWPGSRLPGSLLDSSRGRRTSPGLGHESERE